MLLREKYKMLEWKNMGGWISPSLPVQCSLFRKEEKSKASLYRISFEKKNASTATTASICFGTIDGNNLFYVSIDENQEKKAKKKVSDCFQFGKRALKIDGLFIVHCSKLFMMSVTLLFCLNCAIHHRFFHSHFHLVLKFYLFFAFEMFHLCETANANTISLWLGQCIAIFSHHRRIIIVLSPWYMLIIAFGLQNDRHSIQLHFCLRCDRTIVILV